MNLNREMELASALFGRPEQQGITRVSATALADSAGGTVTVDFGDGEAVEINVINGVSAGDEVIVDIQNGVPIGLGSFGGSGGGGGESAPLFFGTCDSVATAQAKAVVCDEFTASDLAAGTVLFVKFANSQTYSGNPTLNVNGTSAVSIKRNGTTNVGRYEWNAGEVLCFVHDGTYWYMVDGAIASTTYYGVTKLYSGVTSTSNALAATAGAVKQAYDLAEAAAPASSLAAVATTGDYSDLTGTPTIPTAVSDLTNDSGYLTAGDLGAVAFSNDYNDLDNLPTIPAASSAAPQMDGTASAGSSAAYARGDHVHPHDTAKQDKLVSGTNIKTVNGNSLVGSGDVSISLTSEYAFRRFYAGSGAAVQTLSTSAAAVTNMGNAVEGDAAVTHVSNGTFSINAAGVWRVHFHAGMYPNTTAKTRLCVGIYEGTGVSGTRLALGVQAVYNLTANTASQVVTVDAEYVGEFASGDTVTIGAFADVASAKLAKSDNSLTQVTFERMA